MSFHHATSVHTSRALLFLLLVVAICHWRWTDTLIARQGLDRTPFNVALFIAQITWAAVRFAPAPGSLHSGITDLLRKATFHIKQSFKAFIFILYFHCSAYGIWLVIVACVRNLTARQKASQQMEQSAISWRTRGWVLKTATLVPSDMLLKSPEIDGRVT